MADIKKITHIASISNIISTEMGSTSYDTDQSGTAWSTTIVAHKTYWDSVKETIYVRGSDSSLLPAGSGVPSGYYLDQIGGEILVSDSTLISSSFAQPGVVKVKLTYRELKNMSDGAGASPETIPAVHTRDWIFEELPLESHPLLSEDLATYAFAEVTWYDLLQLRRSKGNIDEINAHDDSVKHDAALNIPSAGYTAYLNVLDLNSKGIETAKFYYCVLTKTSTSNTLPGVSTIGMVDTPASSFGSMKPDGYHWIKTTDKISRTGRSGAYNRDEQWQGSTGVWEELIYGTEA